MLTAFSKQYKGANMQLDVNKVIAKYDRIIFEQAKKIILLEVELEMLREQLKADEREVE